MDYTDKEFCLEVWGEMACFTRPELKVERVSYEVITPSSARAIFESIFWKPAIRWEITRIEVLNPIQWASIRRNEIGAVASAKSSGPIFIEEKRQQRNMLFLKDVRYRLYAKLIYIPVNKRSLKNLDDKSSGKENPMKYYEMFNRRALKGQCFNQPYLGTRECVASFRLVPEDEKPLVSPINESKDLGIMLYDMDFSNDKDIIPMFFMAKMNNGVINIPSFNSSDILR